MKILVLGSNGQVGSEFTQVAKPTGCEIIPQTKQDCDITDATAVLQTLQFHAPQFVINTAAYTQVAQAETHTGLATSINHQGAANVAIACAELKIPLLHLSTDYVFDGEQQQAYTETDPTNPLNVYGQSKLAGEQAVIQHCPQAIILRVSAVFGLHGQNFVKTIMHAATTQSDCHIVNDVTTCPTMARHIATISLQIIKHIHIEANFTAWGIYHYCDNTVLNWYEFAEQIAAELRECSVSVSADIHAVASNEIPLTTARPAFSVLNCKKIHTVFGLKQLSWQPEFANFVQELLCHSNPPTS